MPSTSTRPGTRWVGQVEKRWGIKKPVPKLPKWTCTWRKASPPSSVVSTRTPRRPSQHIRSPRPRGGGACSVAGTRGYGEEEPRTPSPQDARAPRGRGLGGGASDARGFLPPCRSPTSAPFPPPRPPPAPPRARHPPVGRPLPWQPSRRVFPGRLPLARRSYRPLPAAPRFSGGLRGGGTAKNGGAEPDGA